MDQQYIEKAEGYPTLGPNYFAARDVAEKFMAQFEAEHFEPLTKKAADAFYDAVRERMQDFLLADVESNIQSAIWHQIDESVTALLSGEEWAMRRYALGGRYDCEKIRAAVAAHIPAELQNARIADLEAENEQLRKDLAWYRR